MELQKLEAVPFGKRLEDLEESAQDAVVRKRAERYVQAVSIACFASCFAVMMPFVLTLGLSLACVMTLGMLVIMSPLAFPLWRYGFGAERRWAFRLAGPQAHAFLASRWDERARLLEATGGFNASLRELKLLPSGADPEAEANLAESMELRRRAVADDAEAYLRAFEAATSSDRARFAAGNVKKAKPVRDPRKAELRAFRKKVRQLEELERALARLQSVADAGMTADLSPYVAAMRFRRDLEEEREALVVRGLKPKKLPGRRVAPKLLASAG